jgi:hypothetical protein
MISKTEQNRITPPENYEHLTFSTALSMISTWLEDVPQIVLAVLVAVWSSELISKVQIAKAMKIIIF